MKSTLVAAALSALALAQPQGASSPTPGPLEQAKVLADASAFVIQHEEILPNFIRLRTTRRLEDSNGDAWSSVNLIVERFLDIDRGEAYKALMLNGQPLSVLRDQFRGESAAADFGSILVTLFRAQTETKFTWQNWVTLRGRETYVFSYGVRAAKSKYHIEVSGQALDLATAYHGFVFVDRQKHVVHRITLYADEIPPSFPIQDVSLTLDYDYNGADSVASLAQ